VAPNAERHRVRLTHPFLAALLAGTFPLFLGALLSDWAYAKSYQIQWSNFAQWLLVGAMVFAGFALVWALVDLLRARPRRGRPLILFILLVLIFVLGFIDSLVHARDAWASMPDGLILSAIVALLSLGAVIIGFSNLRPGAAK